MNYKITIRYNRVITRTFDEVYKSFDEALEYTLAHLKQVMFKQNNSTATIQIEDSLRTHCEYQLTLYLVNQKPVYQLTQLIA